MPGPAPASGVQSVASPDRCLEAYTQLRNADRFEVSFERRGRLRSHIYAIVSGSCSLATLRQVEVFKQAGGSAFVIDPLRIAQGEDVAGQALAWARTRIARETLLFFSTAQASDVQAMQAQLGVQAAGHMVEATLATISRGLIPLGVRQLVVAGGETSGACVQALGITQMKIGAQIDPGVPWCYAQTQQLDQGAPVAIHITLKSGNFGREDFFNHAFEVLA